MRRNGFTLIELTVVVCVVAVLFGVALDRYFRYQEFAERAVLQQNLAAINVALSMKFAAYVASGRPRAIEAEVGRNPIELLARPPENYLGELLAPNIKSLPRPSWYFDRQSGDLIYLPQHNAYLATSRGPIDALGFRVSLTDAKAVAGEPTEVRQPFIGPVLPFSWTVE